MVTPLVKVFAKSTVLAAALASLLKKSPIALLILSVIPKPLPSSVALSPCRNLFHQDWLFSGALIVLSLALVVAVAGVDARLAVPVALVAWILLSSSTDETFLFLPPPFFRILSSCFSPSKLLSAVRISSLRLRTATSDSLTSFSPLNGEVNRL